MSEALFPLIPVIFAALAVLAIYFLVGWNGKLRNVSLEEAFQNPECSYTDQLWTQLSLPEYNLFEQLQATFDKCTRREASSYLILSPDGEVIECDLATHLIWKLKKPNGHRVAFTQVNGQEVSTVLLPVTSTKKYFETLVTKETSSYTMVAQTFKEATDNHRRAVESLAPQEPLLVG